MTVNDKHVIELQIHPKGGTKIGLLAGRDEEELRWLATMLRRTLRDPSQQSHKLTQGACREGVAGLPGYPLSLGRG